MATETYSGRNPDDGAAHTIEVRDGRITAIRPGSGDTDAWLAPGLIDLQVNGFAGYDLNRDDLNLDTVAHLTRALRAQGVTAYAPTLITAPTEKIAHALRMIAAARREDPLSHNAIPFVHLEGPYLSPEDGPRGVHDATCVRAPDIDEVARWQRACDGLIGMITLSPHYPDSVDAIRAFRAAGIHVAIGHTHADPEQIHAAAAAGATLSTHLGNGSHPVVPRHPNYIWAQLADDRLTAAFIADGHHLPADTLTAMIRAKGVERSILVSDAVSLGGCDAGVYDTPVGGRVQLSDDGRLTHLESGLLAGAAKPLADCVAHAANVTGLGLSAAVRMATANPGRFAGNRGRLEVGAPVELIRFHWQPGEPNLYIEDVITSRDS